MTVPRLFLMLLVLLPTTARAQPKPPIQWHLDFSRDGSLVATSGDRVRIYETETGKPLRSIDVATKVIAFSPAVADLFATGGDRGVVRTWKVATKKSTKELRGHRGGISSVAFAPGGRYLASSSVLIEKGHRALGQFRLWDLKSGNTTRSIDIKDGGIEGVSFSRDGNLVAFCRNPKDAAGHVDVYQMQPWKRIASVPLSAPKDLETTAWGKSFAFGLAVRISSDKKTLIIAGGICYRVNPGGYSYACRPTGLVWRANVSRQTAALLTKPDSGYCYSLGLMPDGKQFTTGNGRLGRDEKPLIQMRNAATGKPIWGVASDVEPYGIALSRDGKRVGVCQRRGVHIIDATTGKTLRRIRAPQ